MKRLLSLFLILTTALVLTIPAFADVLWTPENRFFEWNMDQCVTLQRRFTANGERGYVELLSAPDSKNVTGRIENGEILYIYWRFGNWGYVDGRSEGWVALEELDLIYDYISFAEEYGDTFTDYDFKIYAPLLEKWEGTTLTLWPYPGAAQADYVWQDAGNAMLEVKNEEYFSQIYTDENGLTWGFCSYLWGHRNFWVCLDAPAGRDDPAVQAGEMEIPVYAPPRVELPVVAQPSAQGPKLSEAYLMLIVLVSALVVVTGVMLVLMKKNRRKNRTE